MNLIILSVLVLSILIHAHMFWKLERYVKSNILPEVEYNDDEDVHFFETKDYNSMLEELSKKYKGFESPRDFVEQQINLDDSVEVITEQDEYNFEQKSKR